MAKSDKYTYSFRTRQQNPSSVGEREMNKSKPSVEEELPKPGSKFSAIKHIDKCKIFERQPRLPLS